MRLRMWNLGPLSTVFATFGLNLLKNMIAKLIYYYSNNSFKLKIYSVSSS